MICSDAHTQSHSCWCKLFEWIRIEWIRTGGIRVEDTYWWDMYWWDTFAIPADAHLLNGYVCNGHVLVGYVWNGYVWNGYVWDMYDVLDMYGILVVIGGIRITTFCMDTYWWDTYVWDTFGMDMCGICAMCWICVGYVWWIRLKWICVGYVKCAGYVWDMCGVRYANNLLKNPATKRLSGKKMILPSCKVFGFLCESKRSLSATGPGWGLHYWGGQRPKGAKATPYSCGLAQTPAVGWQSPEAVLGHSSR